MEKAAIPNVTVLATGTDFATKQMQANAGEVMPLHHADQESMLFIYEGECILRMNNEEILLKTGEAVVIPPLVKHQIKAVTDYKGIHFMPKDIKFEFFK
jgi:quercetin dioxygenase-like cupin family protein